MKLPPSSRSRCDWLLLLLLLLTPRALSAGDLFTDPQPGDAPALISKFDDANLRLGASNALAVIGEPAIASLQEALSSDRLDVRIWSAYTLGKIGSPAEAAAPKLAGLLKAPDKNLRAVAARSLGQIASGDAKVVGALANRLSDDDPRVRQWSAEALGAIGPASRPALPRLVKALDDQPTRQAALSAITNIGNAAIPALTAALDDDRIRLEAAEALRVIDPSAAIAAGVATITTRDLATLEIALHNKEKDADARIAAARALGGLGLDAAPALIAAFDAEDQHVSRAASAAFAGIGPQAVPLLQDSLKHESPQVRAASADALAAIGAPAKAAVLDLAAALTDDDRTVRHHTAGALNEFGEAAGQAVPALIKVVHNPRDLEQTRQLALKALVRTGPAQRETVAAALTEAAKDSNYGIRSLAEQMLKSLTPADSP